MNTTFKFHERLLNCDYFRIFPETFFFPKLLSPVGVHCFKFWVLIDLIKIRELGATCNLEHFFVQRVFLSSDLFCLRPANLQCYFKIYLLTLFYKLAFEFYLKNPLPRQSIFSFTPNYFILFEVFRNFSLYISLSISCWLSSFFIHFCFNIYLTQYLSICFLFFSRNDSPSCCFLLLWYSWSTWALRYPI